MQIRDSAWRYGYTSILLHWISAGLIAVLFVMGQIMEDLSRGPEKFELLQIHQSLGMLLMIIVLARLVWRLNQGFPDPVDADATFANRFSRLWHWLLLGIVVALPVSGYLAAETGKADLTFFGLYVLPDFIGNSRGLHEGLEEVHETLSGLIIPLVFVHVVAALKHHYWDRDTTLRRMIKA